MSSASSSANAADILWSAYIDDHTVEFFVRFDKNLNGVASRGGQAFTRIGTAAKMSGRNIGVVGGIVGGLTTELLRMGRQGLQQFTALSKATVMLAARADTLAIALDVVGGNVGYTKSELDDLEKSVEANGITTIATRQTLLQMAEAELDLSKATDISRVAQDAAVVANINSSQATQRIIHGITSLNPLILKHLGLYIDLEREYKKATGLSGDVAGALSTQEKQVIALNAVIKKGETIAGAYDAAMETAGKQAGSTARFMEQLQLEVGRVFQPAFLALILRFNRLLQDATKWLRDNREAADSFASALADGMEFGIKLVEDLAEALSTLPGLIVDVSAQLAKLIGNLSQSEIKDRLEGIMTAGKQAVTLWVGAFVYQIKIIIGLVEIIYDVLLGMVKTLQVVTTWLRRGDMTAALDEFAASGAAAAESMNTWRSSAEEASDDVRIALAKAFGLIDDVGDETEDAADQASRALRGLAEETEELIKKITELNDKIGKDLADIAISMARENLEDWIREQERRIDIASRNLQRIDDINRRHARRRAALERDIKKEGLEEAKSGADKRAKIERDHAKELLDIEIEYGRELQRIRRGFEDDASEAARANDAVAVARLLRKRAIDIREAGISRDEDIEDEGRDYAQDLADLRAHNARIRKEKKDDADERRADLARKLEEELEDAELARQRDIKSLELSLTRERATKELHRKWDMEDLWRKYEDEFQMMASHFSNLEYIDELGLRTLLGQHGQYFMDDLSLWSAYYYNLQQMAAAATPIRYSVGGTPAAYEGTGGYSPEEYYQETGTGGGGSWAYGSGGIGLATGPQQVVIGENEPELVAAIPLSAAVNYNHNINMGGKLTVEGVSPSAEAELIPAIMGVLADFGKELLSQGGG